MANAAVNACSVSYSHSVNEVDFASSEFGQLRLSQGHDPDRPSAGRALPAAASAAVPVQELQLPLGRLYIVSALYGKHNQGC